MEYKVSIDPGTNSTGICVWEDGLPIQCFAIHPVKEATTFVGKVISLGGELGMNLRYYGNLGAITDVAIEDFSHYHSKDDTIGARSAKTSMIKCATVRGALIYECAGWSISVKLISKGNISKDQTKQLARSYGITTKNKDALDAFQIGVCAGFDKRS